MLKAIQYSARVTTLLVLAATLYYFVDDSFFLYTDNKKSVEKCVKEVKGGCPLVFNELEERTAEIYLLRERISQLELDLATLSSCPISLPTEE